MRPRLKYLLDTHAFLWAATDEDRLSAKAARAILTTPCEQLAIADVTLQEIGLLLQFRSKARLQPSLAICSTT